MATGGLPISQAETNGRGWILFRALAVIGAVVALGLAAIMWWANGMRGFPDGYISAFERCLWPVTRLAPNFFAIIAICLGLGAWRPRHLKLLVLLALGLSALYAGVAWWFGTVICEGLDHGQGG